MTVEDVATGQLVGVVGHIFQADAALPVLVLLHQLLHAAEDVRDGEAGQLPVIVRSELLDVAEGLLLGQVGMPLPQLKKKKTEISI